MKRVLILFAVLAIALVGIALPVNAARPSPLTGRWLGQDYGSTDTSNVTVTITPSGRYRITDDAGSICLHRIGEFVPVSLQGRGTFSPDGFTFTTDASDIVYCYTASGRVDTGPIGAAQVFEYDADRSRIDDTGGDPTGTCYWRTGTPQPADCPPPAP